MTMHVHPVALSGNDHEIDDDNDPGTNWRRLGPLVHKVVRRINRPVPTVVLMLELNGFNIGEVD
jgi:hypothetical protein